MLWDFKYLKFWKGKNYRDRNHIHGMETRGEEMRGSVKVHRGTFWGEECYMFSL